MEATHIGHWIGAPLNSLMIEISSEISNRFDIIEHGKDISILSDSNVSFCFFCYDFNNNNDLLESALVISNNLAKNLIIINKSDTERRTPLNNCIYDSYNVNMKGIDLWLDELASKVRLSFSSNHEYLENKQLEPLILKKNVNKELINTLRYIENNLSDTIREEDVAEKCHYSVTYFSKVFHKAIGISFRDYLCNKRINQAKSMLLTDRSSKVAFIAYQCGYSDVSYFSRIFKKKTGMTPCAFRHIH